MFFLLLVVTAAVSCSAQGVDLTVRPDGNGSDVVRAVLSKIDASRAFDTTSMTVSVVSLFMRRLAFARTRDGARASPGGIWDVTTSILARTQRNDNGIDASVYTAVNTYLNIENWKTDVTYQDMRKPLHSGMAVRLYLEYVNWNIVQSSGYIYNLIDLLGQSSGYPIWRDYFQPEYGPTSWRQAVDDLADHEHCRVNADVVFVLDSSGSIDRLDFERVLNFTVDFATELFSNDNVLNRFGVVLYSTNATIPIPLGYYDNITNLIRSIQYIGGWTNTPDGICKMIMQPWREGILRLAIVLTDGMANRNSLVCGTLQEAVARAREEPILMYAIGVGDGVRTSELLQIATTPHFIDHVGTFTDQLTNTQETRSYEICFTATQDPIPEVVQTIGREQQSRLRYTAPQEEGITVRICLINGRLVLYASTSVMNPNSALNEWSRTIHETNQSITCLTEFFGEPSTRVSKRAVDEVLTLYLTIEGVEENNQFSVNSSFGNATFDKNECEFLPPPCDINADCYNTDGSFFCVCKPGYTGNGTGCEDYNECTLDDPCSGDYETCVNTPGGYSCSVNGGQVALTVVLTVVAFITLAIVTTATLIVCFYRKTTKHQSPSNPSGEHSDNNALVNNIMVTAEDNENDWDYTLTITWQENGKEKQEQKQKKN